MQLAMNPAIADARETFDALLQAHRKIVFKVAASYANGVEDRADLAQEIATQLWRAYPAYDEARSFSTWMYRIALNVAISEFRIASRNRRHTVPLDESLHDAPDPNTPPPESDAGVRALHAVIQRLDPLHRALLVLYLEERSTREIAEILGIGESNVTTKLSRLRQRLRAELS